MTTKMNTNLHCVSLFRGYLILVSIVCSICISYVDLSGQIEAPKSDTVFFDANGNELANPGDSIRYRLNLKNSGSTILNGITVPNGTDLNTSLNPTSILTSPIASNDGSYAVTGNIAISVDSMNGLLPNDFDDCHSCLTIVGGGATNNGGMITINADGSFIYDPPVGYTGMDTAVYMVMDGTPAPNCPTTNDAIIVFEISGLAWFIDNNAMASSNIGTFLNPFTSIAAFNGSGGPSTGALISLALGTGSYSESDGLNLLNNQSVIGQGVALNTYLTASPLSVNAYQMYAGVTGSYPSIISTGGMNHGVDLAMNNTLRGFNVGNTMGYGINATIAGNLTVSDLSVTGNGGAFRVSISGNLSSVSFSELSSTNSFEDGISLMNVTGTMAISTGTITNPARNAVNINSGSVGFTYPGAIQKTVSLGNSGIVIQNHSGDVTFSGAITLGSLPSPLTQIGINLNTNTGTYSFGTTTVFTNMAVGFNANNGGTVNVTGMGSTLTASNATALSMTGGTIIGGSNVTFQSISANGGVNPGILLDQTGNTGDFIVTGVGSTSASGGMIQNITDDGVRISNATDIILANMVIRSNGNAVNEHGLQMAEVTGVVDFDNLDVAFSSERNVLIENTSGALVFTADDCLFSDTQSSGTGADGLEIGIRGMTFATATINIDGCSFLRNRTNGLQVLVEGNASVTECDVTNNQFDSEIDVGIGMDLSTNNTASLTYNVIGNTRVRSRNGPAINSTAFNTSTIRGRINDNLDVNVQDQSGYGIRVLSEDNSDVIVEIDGNTISNVHFDVGIGTIARGGSTTMHATINDNNITLTSLGGVFPLYGVEVRAQEMRTLCANVTDNIVALGNGAAVFRVRENAATAAVELQGFSMNAAMTWTGNGNTPAMPISESGAASAPAAACNTVSHPMP